MQSKNDDRLAGKVIVITGASSGFGKGAAREFARAHAAVVLAARRGPLLDALARECETLGGAALAVATDVTDPEAVERLGRAAVGRFGRIDVWVNNAGVGAIGPFERVPLAVHVKVIETTLLGTLYGSYVAYREFWRHRAGVLINIASELGAHTVPYYTSYVAAKHGVVGLTDSLRQEISQQDLPDIHACTILPTAHDTPFFDHAANYTGREVQAPTPLHDPENVVEAIVRLATDPQDREIVGADGVVKILLKRLAPGLSERLAAKQMHRTQLEKAPPAAESPGAVQSTNPIGTEVRGGRSSAGQNGDAAHR